MESISPPTPYHEAGEQRTMIQGPREWRDGLKEWREVIGSPQAYPESLAAVAGAYHGLFQQYHPYFNHHTTRWSDGGFVASRESATAAPNICRQGCGNSPAFGQVV